MSKSKSRTKPAKNETSDERKIHQFKTLCLNWNMRAKKSYTYSLYKRNKYKYISPYDMLFS